MSCVLAPLVQEPSILPAQHIISVRGSLHKSEANSGPPAPKVAPLNRKHMYVHTSIRTRIRDSRSQSLASPETHVHCTVLPIQGASSLNFAILQRVWGNNLWAKPNLGPANGSSPTLPGTRQKRAGKAHYRDSRGAGRAGSETRQWDQARRCPALVFQLWTRLTCRLAVNPVFLVLLSGGVLVSREPAASLASANAGASDGWQPRRASILAASQLVPALHSPDQDSLYFKYNPSNPIVSCSPSILAPAFPKPVHCHILLHIMVCPLDTHVPYNIIPQNRS